MERIDHHGARDQGRDAAAARIVRAAAIRLALALAIASFTAALSLAALTARTAELHAAPAPLALPTSAAALDGATTAATDPAPVADAPRTDI